MANQRFTRSDWIALGLDSIRENGPSALTIDALCEASGKTRGSFYFHFGSIEEYQIALTSDWVDRFTSQIIRREPKTTNRSDLLNELAGRLDLDLETGIRQLALISPAISTLVNQADQDRADWLASLYRESGRFDEQQAEMLAKIELAAFTGFRLIDPDMTPAEARELYDAFLELTGR